MTTTKICRASKYELKVAYHDYCTVGLHVG